MTSPLKMVQGVFLALGAAFASLPGLEALRNGVFVPPEREDLYAGCLLAFGCLSLILVCLNRKRIGRARRAARFVAIMGLAAALFLIGYITLFHICILQSEGEQVVIPLWATGPIAEEIRLLGGRGAVANEYSPWRIRDWVQETSLVARLSTEILLLIAYVGIFVSLSSAFGVAAFAVKSSGDHPSVE